MAEKKDDGLFSKIKEGWSETVTAAGLELKYVQGKKSGFKHPEEMEEQLSVMRVNREEIPLLRERLSSLTTLAKETAESEDKGGAEFLQMSQSPGQNPHLAQIHKIYADGMVSIAAQRFQLHAVMEEVKEEWKQLETVDLHELRVKQDQANRALSDSRYWSKEKNFARANEYEQKYKFLSADLVEKIHELRMKKEELLPGYLLRNAQAQVIFFRNALKEAEKMEASIRNLGPVKPIEFAGIARFKTIGQIEYNPQPQPSNPPPFQPPISSLPMSAPPTKALKAKALYSFETSTPKELAFNAGDILDIISQDGQWWTAELKGKRGLIPFNYVQLI